MWIKSCHIHCFYYLEFMNIVKEWQLLQDRARAWSNYTCCSFEEINLTWVVSAKCHCCSLFYSTCTSRLNLGRIFLCTFSPMLRQMPLSTRHWLGWANFFKSKEFSALVFIPSKNEYALMVLTMNWTCTMNCKYSPVSQHISWHY